MDWPPVSSDCNPLDYYFWDALSTKVYENQHEPFISVEFFLKRMFGRVLLDEHKLTA